MIDYSLKLRLYSRSGALARAIRRESKDGIEPRINPGSGSKPSPEKSPGGSSLTNWNIFVFLPARPSGKPPKLPPDKGWMELLLLLLKVAAATVALIKAIGLLA